MNIEKIIDSALDFYSYENKEIYAIFYICLLTSEEIFIISYDTNTKNHNIIKEKCCSKGFKIEFFLQPDKALFCYLFSKTTDLLLSIKLFIFSHSGLQKIIKFINKNKEILQAKEYKLISEISYRNITNILKNSESIIPSTISIHALFDKEICFYEFLAENSEFSKTAQIWAQKINENNELLEISKNDLISQGILPKDNDEILIESLIKNRNYDIINKMLVKKDKFGNYEFKKYKYIADIILQKFDDIKNALEFGEKMRNMSSVIKIFYKIIESKNEKEYFY